MTTAELQAQISAMRESIQAQQEKLDELQAKIQNDNEVPDQLEWDIKNVEEGWCIDSSGGVYKANVYLSASGVRKRRVFKTEKYAQMYSEKTQHIADLLHFKWLYDRDFEPDWDDKNEKKYTVWYCPDEKKFLIDITSRSEYRAAVYFSTAELARKCADWLNRKAGRNE